MNRALISLGSNVGDRRETLLRAGKLLGHLPQTRLVEMSRWYATAPVGGPEGQGEFLNGAAVLETKLPAAELLRELQRMELTQGRSRTERWAERTLDLDLLLVGNQRQRTSELILPHPRMSFRPFVMIPACELAADWPHPILNCTLEELLSQFNKGSEAVGVIGGTPEERRAWGRRIAMLYPRLVSKIETQEDSGGPACLMVGMRNFFHLPPRFTVSLDNTVWRGIPRLSFTDCQPENYSAELRAAIDCLWPLTG